MLREVRRILKPGGNIIFSLYVSCSQFIGAPRALIEWQECLALSGLVISDCQDVSQEWRTFMRQKHEDHWKARAWLRKKLGDLAERELSVSQAMLGLDGRPAFLDVVQRYEIVAGSPFGAN